MRLPALHCAAIAPLSILSPLGLVLAAAVSGGGCNAPPRAPAPLSENSSLQRRTVHCPTVLAGACPAGGPCDRREAAGPAPYASGTPTWRVSTDTPLV